MKRSRLILSGLVLGGPALVLGPASAVSPSAAESIDVGATASSPSATGGCLDGTTYFPDVTATGPGYQTTAGVVTSWSTMAPAGNGMAALKVARQGPAGTYTITGSAQPAPLVANRLNSFRTRIPVVAGDVIALFLPEAGGTGGCQFETENAGDTVQFLGTSSPDPAVGTVIVTGSTSFFSHVNVSARIEPDMDGDGYGDLTQDACPVLKNTHDDCLAPNTFLEKAPKRLVAHGKTAKAKVAFFASEDGSTFTCSVDKATARTCTSPLKAKLKPGKHTVTITATDKVGNVDPTPLTVKIKVRKA